MIELGGFSPALCSMTDSAFRPELTEVLVFFFMAIVTFLGCGLQVGDVARIHMTFGARCQRVKTNQIERDLIMVEF